MTDISPQLYERIGALEAQVAFLFELLSLPPNAAGASAPVRSDGVPQQIIDLVHSGKKIEAIKVHRQLFGTSLVEAKTAVDRIG